MSRTEFKASRTPKAMCISTSLNIPMTQENNVALWRLKWVLPLKFEENTKSDDKEQSNWVQLIKLPQGLRQMEITKWNMKNTLLNAQLMNVASPAGGSIFMKHICSPVYYVHRRQTKIRTAQWKLTSSSAAVCCEGGVLCELYIAGVSGTCKHFATKWAFTSTVRSTYLH